MSDSTYKLYTDGGARGNPGPAAVGVVLKNSVGKIVREVGSYLGETTNNQAEYKALILGLRTAIEQGVTNLVCYLDSELVVKQLTGEYKVKNIGLKPLTTEVAALEKSFEDVSYIHVTRDKNKKADQLVNQVLDEVAKTS
jgi:ribonuclease HI